MKHSTKVTVQPPTKKQIKSSRAMQGTHIVYAEWGYWDSKQRGRGNWRHGVSLRSRPIRAARGAL